MKLRQTRIHNAPSCPIFSREVLSALSERLNLTAPVVVAFQHVDACILRELTNRSGVSSWR